MFMYSSVSKKMIYNKNLCKWSFKEYVIYKLLTKMSEVKYWIGRWFVSLAQDQIYGIMVLGLGIVVLV